MKHPVLKQVANYIIFALTIFLIFLIVFESYLSIPEIVFFLGRFHPVVLHFPIVLLLLTVFYSWLPDKSHLNILITSSTLMALITAMSGFLLSLERGSKGEILTWHQWLGISVTFLAVIWMIIEDLNIQHKLFAGFIKILILVTIILTGHYGGMVTHGEDFLSFSKDDRAINKVFPDNPLIYDDLVKPILDDKCASCHNPNKTKGGLILTDYHSLLKGGESGPAINTNDPGSGELTRRIRLSMDHEDHMPPEDKIQMTNSEISLLDEWISSGASNSLLLGQLNTGDKLHEIVKSLISLSEGSKWSNLPPIEESMIYDLSSDYCTIKRISDGSNALSVCIFPHQGYDPIILVGLTEIYMNIVELDLSELPLGQEEFEIIPRCTSLELLEIDGTPLNDVSFRKLETLQNLKILKAHNTSISDASVEIVQSFQNLEKLFVWETEISETAISKIKESMPTLQINTGIGDIEFTSILPNPIIQPRKFFFIDPFEISFQHPLNDINIFYTIDGSDPGPEKIKFEQSLIIDETSVVKFIAAKEGWEPSPIDSVHFHKSLVGPEKFEIEYAPDPKYSGSGERTIFDLEKGTYNLLDSSWLGFQETKMLINCEWESIITLNNIILSSLVSTGIHVFPPQRIEVRGGIKPGEMEMLGSINFSVLQKPEGPHFEFFSCQIKPEPIKYLSISAIPLSKLPSWHGASGSPGWFFVDEVLFENLP